MATAIEIGLYTVVMSIGVVAMKPLYIIRDEPDFGSLDTRLDGSSAAGGAQDMAMSAASLDVVGLGMAGLFLVLALSLVHSVVMAKRLFQTRRSRRRT